MSLKESINDYKNLVIKEVLKLNKKTRIAALTGMIGCIVLSTGFAMASGTEVYSLTIAGREAGYITDTALIDEAVKGITANYANRKDPMEISVDKKGIKYEETDFEKNEIPALTEKELEKKIADSKLCTVKAWAVNIDGINIAAAASKEGADQILAGVKNHYLSNGGKLIRADFKEKVVVTQATVAVANVMKPDDVVSLLVTGEKNPEVYNVKNGDTIWDIAAENCMSVDELQMANPGFDPNKLYIGQQLNLFVVKPFVTVETKELIASTEKIDFNTVYEETSSLNQGELKIKTAGVCGTKEVSSEVTKENGVIIASTVVSSVVTAEPQTQIALKGTKKAALYSAKRGSGSGRTVSVEASGRDIIAYAKKFVGVPYVHGGSTPKGFDCSGFTQYVMENFGGDLPRTTGGQYSSGMRLEKSELQPGDLVFFKPSASASSISHVGIYVGGGKYIHAPQPGESVKISDLSNSYGVQHYYGAVRVTK